MPRKTTDALTIVPSRLPERIPPPRDLSADQRALWLACTLSKPVEWFGPDSEPTLKEYVRAAAMCDQLETRIQTALAGGDMGEVKGLLDMRDKESKRVLSTATKLRLTQQSRYTPMAAATANRKAGVGLKPWQA